MDLTHTQKLVHEWRIVHTRIYCPKITSLNDVGHLIAPLEIWMGTVQSETAQVQHLENTTTRWGIFISYIGRQLFICEIIYSV